MLEIGQKGAITLAENIVAALVVLAIMA